MKIRLSDIKSIYKRRFLLQHVVSSLDELCQFSNDSSCVCFLYNFNKLDYNFLLSYFSLQGLEIYGKEDDITSHMYLSVKNRVARDNLYSAILRQPSLNLSDSKQEIMTLQWQNGTISNFDYLLYVNR